MWRSHRHDFIILHDCACLCMHALATGACVPAACSNKMLHCEIPLIIEAVHFWQVAAPALHSTAVAGQHEQHA